MVTLIGLVGIICFHYELDLRYNIIKSTYVFPGVDISNEQKVSIIEHREELEVSKNLIVNIKVSFFIPFDFQLI